MATFYTLYSLLYWWRKTHAIPRVIEERHLAPINQDDQIMPAVNHLWVKGDRMMAPVWGTHLHGVGMGAIYIYEEGFSTGLSPLTIL